MDRLSGSTVRLGSLRQESPARRCRKVASYSYHPLLLHLPPSMDQMPSMQHLLGFVIGLGSLPGHRTETDLPILPDEQKIREKPHRPIFYHRKPTPASSQHPQ
ncbi:hypothetical protein BKA70DRAFT_1332090 [Coprinopsis sp. MPI-PUGE-AT-0042]|nr:hypothetical protein BKA70DRAFT_1332090 [Coprinopsis sp. MPI-PUGE-AT-0042]